MRFSAGSPLALTMLLLLGAAPALQAQSSPAPASAAGIYSCIDDQGRRITADRPIAGCSAKEQRILNRDGSLKTVYPPTLTVDERAEKEAAERKAAEARAAQADAVRRDRNLLARYPNEAPHRKAREAALDTVRVAIKASEKRLQALEAERKPLLDEAEFYPNRALPPKLKGQLDANDAAGEAQRALVATQAAEMERINTNFDAELERLRRLWTGAPAGSLGPVQPLPARTAASAARAAPR